MEWIKVDANENINEMDNGWLSNSINEELSLKKRNWRKGKVTPIIQEKGKPKIKRIKTKRVKKDASHHVRILPSGVDVFN